MSAANAAGPGLAEAASAVDSLWLLIGLLLVVDVWAITLVVSSAASAGEKVLWGVVILAVPILGPVAWYVLGPKPDLVRERGAVGASAGSEEGGP